MSEDLTDDHDCDIPIKFDLSKSVSHKTDSRQQINFVLRSTGFHRTRRRFREMGSDELASRLSSIRKRLDKMRQSIASGSLQEAVRHVPQLNSLTGQLVAELAGSK